MAIDTDDIEPEYKEFEEAGTYHRSFDLPPDATQSDIMNFILDEGRFDEDYFVRYSYTDKEGKTQYLQTDMHFTDDYDDWIEDYEDDADLYEIEGAGGFTVVFRGAL